MPRQFKSTDTSIWGEQFGTGKDGALTISTSGVEFLVATSPFTTNANAYGVFTGTSGDTFGTATDSFGFWTSYVSVGDYVLIHQTSGTNAGAWELNVVMSGIPSSGGSSTINLKYPLQNNYLNSGNNINVCQIIKCPQFSSFTLNSGNTLHPRSNNAAYGGLIAFFCNGTTTINGTIQGNGRGFYGGPTTGGTGYQGNSSTSNSYQISTTNNGSGGGGGGIGDGAAAGGGGGGGHATAGTTGGAGQRTPGTGGTTDGNAGLTDFNLGAGGGGGGYRTGAGAGPGSGGAGGAGIIIFSNNIVIAGGLVVNGANGANATGSSSHGGGGGGAGGAILIKSINATLGTNLITANAGSGGSGAANGGAGGAGGVGRIHLDYAESYTGSTTPTLDVTNDSSLYPSGGSFLYNIL